MPFKHYAQRDAMDCGPACLRMVARHYGRHYALPQLRVAHVVAFKAQCNRVGRGHRMRLDSRRNSCKARLVQATFNRHHKLQHMHFVLLARLIQAFTAQAVYAQLGCPRQHQ